MHKFSNKANMAQHFHSSLLDFSNAAYRVFGGLNMKREALNASWAHVADPLRSNIKLYDVSMV